MSRIVWPHALLLTAGQIDDVSAAVRVERIRKQFFPSRKASDFGPPVALRWASLPALGLPRRPFEVFRRARPGVAELVPLATTPIAVDGLQVFELGGVERCEVQFRATPQSGSRLAVVGLDRRGEAIPGQRLAFTASGGGRLRCPGLFALRLSGKGSLTELAGQAQAALDGTPVAWPVAKPEALLAVLRERELSPLGLVHECLEAGKDESFEALQADFRRRASLPGLRQADLPGAEGGTEAVELELPVASLVQLAVAQDGDGQPLPAARGSGRAAVRLPRRLRLRAAGAGRTDRGGARPRCRAASVSSSSGRARGGRSSTSRSRVASHPSCRRVPQRSTAHPHSRRASASSRR
jgi:hypothetical protein